MTSLAKKEAKLAELQNRYEELKPVIDEGQKLITEIHVLANEIYEAKKFQSYNEISRKTQFVRASMPSMGSPAEEGSAVFETESDARRLCKEASSYYASYALKWSGPGKYGTVTTWYQDHDNDFVYTATFVKEVET